MNNCAVAYARFSSDNQRDESIDAQLRAIHEYAERNGFKIVGEYIDRARSATTDNRPEFLKMVEDAKEGKFEAVLVHKLDRFARNRADSIGYRMKLRQQGVRLISVLEQLDESSPESVILESVLEGLAEYYSKNLSREVKKGMKENALRCQHTGGRPPLGYDVDPVTKHYVLNEAEAEIVRFIFQSVAERKGYGEIINLMNSRGWRTKRGLPFGKNSIHEILRNEKYRGVYIFNRVESKTIEGKRNNHASKPEKEMTRIPDGVPRIVSDELFDKVQDVLQGRKRLGLHAGAKELYLLSGRVFCGVCGQAFCGNRKNSGRSKLPHVTYRCNNRYSRSGTTCKNKEVNRDALEQFVLEKIANEIFSEGRFMALLSAYNQHLQQSQNEVREAIRAHERIIAANRTKERNLVSAIAETGNTALITALEKIQSDIKLAEKEAGALKLKTGNIAIPPEIIERAFHQARSLFLSGKLAECKQLVDLSVKRIEVFPEEIILELNTSHCALEKMEGKDREKLRSGEQFFNSAYRIARKELLTEYGTRAPRST